MQTNRSATTAAGSPRCLPSDAEEGMVGRALAVKMPGDAHRQETGRKKEKEDKEEEGESVTVFPTNKTTTRTTSKE